jgi:general secretion pathway protein D
MAAAIDRLGLGSTPRMLLTITFLTALLSAPLLAQEPATEPGTDPTVTEIQVPEGVLEEEGDIVTLRFTETEGEQLRYDQFIKMCQQVTGRVFTIDSESNNVTSRLENPVVLIGKIQIERSEFYSFFQIMMKINGLVCVEQGAGDMMVTMITADKISGSTPNPVVTANAKLIEPEDTAFFANQPGIYIATVVKLKHVDPGGISIALSKLFGTNANNSVQALTTDQALMINGYGPLVAAAVRFVQYLDVKPEVEQPVFKKVRLEEASAEELQELLTEIVEDLDQYDSNRVVPTSRSRSGGSSGPSAVPIETTIIASTRDNSLIITASEESMNRILNLIAELDTRVEVPESNFHLYVVQHIPVADLEDNLKKFLSDAHQEEQNAQNAGGSGSNTITERQQKIVVEIQENTNSLLVSATRSKWAELKMLLDRLDQPQPQVLIETALIEISEDFSKEIGFEFANANDPGPGVVTGSVTTNSGLTGPDANGDRAVDIFQDGLTAGILEGQAGGGFSIPFLLRAAQGSGNANVLSKPAVLVSNNKPASIESKDLVPYTTSTLGQVGQQENVEWQEAGIILNITPSISSSSFLRLSISLEVSTFGAVTDPDLPPPVASRIINTEVLVPDGATMWIGGIIKDDALHSESGIPFLSDIPLIGWIFGKRSDNKSKTTLFFFCTPQIIGDFQELEALSEKGKAQAAETIGLERLRIIDPEFQQETPADVILKDGNTGMVDPGMIQGPALVAPAGEVDGATEPLDPVTLQGPLRPDPQNSRD